jgi:hypothetical protein
MSQSRCCEICGEGSGRIKAVDFGTRFVSPCERHVLAAKRAAVRSVEALRASFVEEQGRRALVGRRAPDERRLFPPRPEGRRQRSGRRASDARDRPPSGTVRP